ncbi:MAG TPA: toxin-antitoxin system YwqK family antitoxin [Phaeodactylibacter sp.]|nr:toxin-antitoxin system YwqK family antitoxin [Phaeodactylibacter sp.]
MKKIILLLSLFFGLFASTKLQACCVAERYSLSELLLSDEDPRSILIVQVDSTWVGGRYRSFQSRAIVQEVFRKAPKGDTIYISSGSAGSSAGGKFLQNGKQYLLVSSSRDGIRYGGFVCDVFSYELGNPYNGMLYDRLEVIRQYFQAVQNNYTGSLRLASNGFLFGEGEMLHGKPEGTWKHYEPERRTQEETILRSTATYHKGYLHGISKSYNSHDGKRYVHTVKNFYKGKLRWQQRYSPIGEGSFLAYEEHLCTEGLYTFVKSKAFRAKDTLSYEREQIRINIKPSSYLRLRSLLHGDFKTYHPNGNLKEEGTYFFGAKVGQWLYYPEQGGTPQIENYPILEKEENLYTDYFETGSYKNRGALKNGKPQGEWNTYNQDGFLIQTLNFQEGTLEGLYQKYHPLEGTVQTISYFKNGKLNGQSLSFAKDGKTITHSGQYIHGNKTGHWKYYDNDGTLLQEEHYVQGKLKGKQTFYFPNGKIRKQANFFNGGLHGAFVVYNEKGQIIKQGEYLQGQKIGTWTKRNESLSVLEITTYMPSENPYLYQSYDSITYLDLETNEPISLEQFNERRKKQIRERKKTH